MQDNQDPKPTEQKPEKFGGLGFPILFFVIIFAVVIYDMFFAKR